MDDLVVGVSADRRDPCGHRIHIQCSEGLFQCPICRKNLYRNNPWMRIVLRISLSLVQEKKNIAHGCK